MNNNNNNNKKNNKTKKQIPTSFMDVLIMK